MANDLRGKVVIVTGTSRVNGVGTAIGQRLARAGADLLLVADRPLEGLEAVAEICRAEPGAGRVECRLIDLAAEGAADRLIEMALELFGRLDVVVNNAAYVIRDVAFGDYTYEDFDRSLAINVAAPFFIGQAAARVFAESGGGRIINIGSRAGSRPRANSIVYAMTKNAMAYVTRAMAYELAEHRIITNMVSPGSIRSDVNLDRETSNPEILTASLSQIPIGRLGERAEVAEVVAFFASSDATYLVGNNVDVSGGYQGSLG